MTWGKRNNNTVPCVCGRSFRGSAALATHKRTCEAFIAQTPGAAESAKTSTRPQEHREIASELREAIETNARAAWQLRAAEASYASAKEFARLASSALEDARAAAASIGLQGSDAESVEAIRAWLRGGTKS
jgi:crotonobetainyl-CoA:carnitine CoA-transferase CaiB-like acyl-CoA transferase